MGYSPQDCRKLDMAEQLTSSPGSDKYTVTAAGVSERKTRAKFRCLKIHRKIGILIMSQILKIIVFSILEYNNL